MYLSARSRRGRASALVKKAILDGEDDVGGILRGEGLGSGTAEREELAVSDQALAIRAATTAERQDLVACSTTRVEVKAGVRLHLISVHCGPLYIKIVILPGR